jgi:hypothetical protein
MASLSPSSKLPEKSLGLQQEEVFVLLVVIKKIPTPKSSSIGARSKKRFLFLFLAMCLIHAITVFALLTIS